MHQACNREVAMECHKLIQQKMNVQWAAKLFKHLRYVVSKTLYLMPFYEINICEVMIFRLYTIYNKHEMIKISSQNREKLHVLQVLV